jgi:hypothetical protein
MIYMRFNFENIKRSSEEEKHHINKIFKEFYFHTKRSERLTQFLIRFYIDKKINRV